MPRGTAEALRIISRRSKVAAMVLRGITNQFEIAERLGLGHEGQSTVSRDLKVIADEWRQATVRDISEAMGKELARLDAVEKEAWEALERSKAERQSSRTRARRGGQNDVSEAETKKEQRDGDSRFMKIILECVKQRREILGLDAPTRLKLGGDDELPPIRTKVDWSKVPVEDLRQLRALRDRLAGLNAPGQN